MVDAAIYSIWPIVVNGLYVIFERCSVQCQPSLSLEDLTWVGERRSIWCKILPSKPMVLHVILNVAVLTLQFVGIIFATSESALLYMVKSNTLHGTS